MSEKVRANFEELASLLLALFTSLCDAGKGKEPEALLAVKGATTICHELVDTYAPAIEPILALSLRELFIRIHHSGIHVEAVTTSEVVVDIHRKLAGIQPSAFEFALLEALHTFYSYLHSAGKKKEA